MTVGTATAQHAVQNWREPLGRAGLVAKGVLYFVLGVLAIQFVRGDTSSDQVSQAGAIEAVADQPLGRFLLVALVLGLIALMIWHAIQAFTGDPVEGSEPSDRMKYAVKAVLYGALVATSLKIVADAWSSGADSSAAGTDNAQNQKVGVVAVRPAGRSVPRRRARRDRRRRRLPAGLRAHDQQEVHGTPGPAASASRAVEFAGRVGYLARAVVFAIIGVFFVVAAVQHDPNESKGISGSIQELAEHSWGPAVLWGVAIGLVLFGLFCFAESRYRHAA